MSDHVSSLAPSPVVDATITNYIWLLRELLDIFVCGNKYKQYGEFLFCENSSYISAKNDDAIKRRGMRIVGKWENIVTSVITQYVLKKRCISHY